MKRRLASFLVPGMFLALAAACGACGGNVTVEPSGGGGDGGDATSSSSTGAGPSTGIPPSPCVAGLIECDGVCVDPDTDSGHCGGCHVTCPLGPGATDTPCIDGECAAPCESGYTLCYYEFCYDLLHDPYNCGGCGVTCAPGEACVNGDCQDGGDCVTCAEIITPDANPNGLPICPGASEEIYYALVGCICEDTCAFTCANNVCVGQDITLECQSCVLDTAGGCGDPFADCANDL